MPVAYWGRIDSNSANNPALNLTGDAALQFTFVPSGGSGDILLEYNGGDVDPDTQLGRLDHRLVHVDRDPGRVQTERSRQTSDPTAGDDHVRVHHQNLWDGPSTT